MAVHAPNPGLYCAQRLLHSSIALNGRCGQSHSSDGDGCHWRFASRRDPIMSAVPRSEKHRQWPSPAGFRALKKRRSTRLNRPTPCTPRGVQGADLAAPLVGNGENGRRRRRGQFRGQSHFYYILLASTTNGYALFFLYFSLPTC